MKLTFFSVGAEADERETALKHVSAYPLFTNPQPHFHFLPDMLLSCKSCSSFVFDMMFLYYLHCPTGSPPGDEKKKNADLFHANFFRLLHALTLLLSSSSIGFHPSACLTEAQTAVDMFLTVVFI